MHHIIHLFESRYVTVLKMVSKVVLLSYVFRDSFTLILVLYIYRIFQLCQRSMQEILNGALDLSNFLYSIQKPLFVWCYLSIFDYWHLYCYIVTVLVFLQFDHWEESPKSFLDSWVDLVDLSMSRLTWDVYKEYMKILWCDDIVLRQRVPCNIIYLGSHVRQK